MTVVVFAGPSIFGIDAGELAGFDLRPPAACGDLLKALGAGATSIGLIDGVFENAPSTWHKEILAALAGGVMVCGAASMGALRAAECRHFGMIGIGRVFHDYATGRRTADADVAVLHAPADLQFRPLTEAMVDVEASLENVLAHALIEPEENTALRRVARSIHFKHRTWRAILDRSGLAADRRQVIARLFRAHRTSQKRDDARALLRHLGSSGASAPPNRWEENEPFARTLFFDALERRALKNGKYRTSEPVP